MASINDNLFTTLMRFAVPRELGCRILTQWGPVTIRFSEKGLQELTFDPQDAPAKEADSVFRGTFLRWIANYELLSPAQRWRYLAPKGTDFQLSVWRALTQIPHGATVCYQDIAKKIGKPKANRAVGSAVGANPISVLIPCHRVIRASGRLGNYRWGMDRKLALLDAEQEAGSDLTRLFK